MNRFYDMGADKLAYAGMDDAGEMSSWYVFNAIGLYTFSPADPEYIITVPLFDKIKISMDKNKKISIIKKGKGKKINKILYNNKKLDGWFISHDQLIQGKDLVVYVE